MPAALIRWASAAVPEQPSSINLVQPSGDKWMPHEMPLRAVSLSSSRSLPEALPEFHEELCDARLTARLAGLELQPSSSHHGVDIRGMIPHLSLGLPPHPMPCHGLP